ncbi:hypothetical protein GCM10007860_21080 [Chitiniphilus shinanonensis]|uniref:AraC effector-binding domain-containing protein n=1 Tax=Chitiniphilus shinanonensis TaxID=553088 RepID=A0ABQ6BZ28_9NEIS|nr:GyrI-like domain-containing protein [Chitiniphilus shinanonensis]GLS04959.1 hypothetical protein GCM10007860_21080 [Chitiniphilus shinanonensis]
MPAVEICVIQPFPVAFFQRFGRDHPLGNSLGAAQSAWQAISTYVEDHKLLGPDTSFIGLYRNNHFEVAPPDCCYEACVVEPLALPPAPGLTLGNICGGRYAVIRHHGAYETMGDTWKALYLEWLPRSGERLRRMPSFEWCRVFPPAQPSPDAWLTELWLPLERQV